MTKDDRARERMTKKGEGGEKLSGPETAKGDTALIVLDMVSDFEFKDGDELFEQAKKAAGALSKLIIRARKARVPVIFVNDNFGKWNEDFRTYASSVASTSERGREIIRLVGPQEGDFHILKPQRSAFYETPLALLLTTLNVSKLVLTGMTTDICVLFTANDAYMRGFEVRIPSDCTAAVKVKYHNGALDLLKRVANADVRRGSEIRFNTAST